MSAAISSTTRRAAAPACAALMAALVLASCQDSAPPAGARHAQGGESKGFFAWLTEQGSASGAQVAPAGLNRIVPEGDAARGRAIVASGLHGCGACHHIPGIASARGVVGPSLAGIARRSFVAGVLPHQPSELVAFLQDPPALIPWTGMPNVGLSRADAFHVAAFLYTLEGRP